MSEVNQQDLPFYSDDLIRIKRSGSKKHKSEKYKIITLLLSGNYYLMESKRRSVRGYVLYHGNMNPSKWYSEKGMRFLWSTFKTDRKGRITLNLSKVRQQHGKSLVKQLYKIKAAAARSGN